MAGRVTTGKRLAEKLDRKSCPPYESLSATTYAKCDVDP